MTATPPRADLRTLAAEAIWANGWVKSTVDGRASVGLASPEDIADAVLAAVLPEHRRMVLGEAGEALERARQARIEADGHPIGSGLDEAEWVLDRLAAAAPPAGLSAPVPASTAPAVPEEADGQRAGDVVRCACDDFGDGECVVHDALTYAEMESERDRLARELHEAQMMIERLTVDDDARDGTRRAWLELEHWRTVIVPELMEQRDRLGTDRDRLAYQVAHCQRVVEAAKAWRGNRYASASILELAVAVDALSDAEAGQTEDNHG